MSLEGDNQFKTDIISIISSPKNDIPGLSNDWTNAISGWMSSLAYSNFSSPGLKESIKLAVSPVILSSMTAVSLQNSIVPAPPLAPPPYPFPIMIANALLAGYSGVLLDTLIASSLATGTIIVTPPVSPFVNAISAPVGLSGNSIESFSSALLSDFKAWSSTGTVTVVASGLIIPWYNRPVENILKL